MRKLLFITSSALLIGFYSCKSNEKTPSESKSAIELKKDANCPDLIIENVLYNSIVGEGVQIKEASIRNNTLYLKCQYSGCESDELVVAFNGMVKKSYPAQAAIKIGYTESGSCDQIVTTELCCNITDLASYGKIMLYLNGKKEPVLYDTTSK